MPTLPSPTTSSPTTSSPTTMGPLLSKVRLRALTASARAIRPLDTSTIRWDVDAPAGVTIALDGHKVAARGTLAVRPFPSHTYTLYARAGTATRRLGAIRIEVDEASCLTTEMPRQTALWRTGIEDQVTADRSLAYTSDGRPVVTVDTAGVTIGFAVTKQIAGLPDPEVRVRMRFDVGVDDDGQLHPFFAELDVAIDVPFYVSVFAASKIERARCELERKLRDGVAAGLAAMAQLVPAGRQAVQAWFLPESQVTEGALEIKHCPAR